MGFQLDIFLKWEPEVDIVFSIMRQPLGIKKITISGALSIVLTPLLEEMPILGGIQIFMINQPELDLDFTGMANIVDFPVVASVIRNLIMTSIADFMVLPNRMFFPFTDETQVSRPARSLIARISVAARRCQSGLLFSRRGAGLPVYLLRDMAGASARDLWMRSSEKFS